MFAVALGVALFVSSYASITGIERSIQRSARALAGKAEWMVTGSAPASVPEEVLTRLRQAPGVVSAPFITASASTLGDRPEQLNVWGIDTGTDAMVQLFGAQQAPDLAAVLRMRLIPDSILVPKGFAASHGLSPGATIRVTTRTGPATLTVAGTVEDSPVFRAMGGALALMEFHRAEALFGQPGMLDSIEVAGASEALVRSLARGYQVRSVDSLSPEASDALLRIRSLYSLSLVAMLIGCFVVFSSVQVSVLERMKELATFRALGASRGQLLTALLLEWLLVGLLGSVAGVMLGVELSSVILHAITSDVNSMLPLVKDARPEMTAPGFALGVAIGLVSVLAAAFIPTLAAVRESPLLALRPHTYRLRHRQLTAFWTGLAVLVLGLWLSASGSYARTLVAIVLSFLGLALLMPHAVLVAAAILRHAVARVFGFAGFLATDNLRKAPQRTAFNVIALGGALAIMVTTAALIQGFTQSTHRWIRSSLPFDITVAAIDPGANLYTDETLPRALLDKVRHVPGVSFAYGVRSSFAPLGGHDIMVIGIPTLNYLEAHRRHGTIDWARPIAEPRNTGEMLAGRGAFASENLLALTGLRVGDSIRLQCPGGTRRFRILGSLEDYSWPRGLLAIDLDVMGGLWKSTGLTYIDSQVADRAETAAVKSRLVALTRDRYAAHVLDQRQIVGLADDVLRQTTSAANAQVWLAAIIGFLGIGNSLIVGVLQRQREIGLLRAVGMSRGQLQKTVAIEALLIGVCAGAMGTVGGLLGGWLPLRHFTFAVSGYLYPMVVPWADMAKVFVAAVAIAVVAAIVPARRVAQIPVLTSIALE